MLFVRNNNFAFSTAQFDVTQLIRNSLLGLGSVLDQWLNIIQMVINLIYIPQQKSS